MNDREQERAAVRYITTWRKPDAILDWDFHVSESIEEARRVVANILAQGALQWRTYPIGEKVAELSSEF